MPESAEVKLVTEYLRSKLSNRIIKDWIFTSGQYEDVLPDNFDDFFDKTPFLVENVECKGKLIYFTLFNEDGYFYILHSLRMTGRWQEYKDSTCRWYILLDKKEKIWFKNPRCLATLKFTSDKKDLDDSLNKLGPDILTEDLNLRTWNNLIQLHRNKNVTSFLMNQSILSGIGNYIKAESLYYAKISPLRKIGNLSEGELDKLFEGIRIIPRLAYCKKGLSLKDFANEKGIKGTFENDLKIYGKKFAKRSKTSDGRITYWDPLVQK